MCIQHLLMARLHLVSLHVEGLPQLLLEHLVSVLLLSLLHLPQLIGVVCKDGQKKYTP